MLCKLYRTKKLGNILH